MSSWPWYQKVAVGSSQDCVLCVQRRHSADLGAKLSWFAWLLLVLWSSTAVHWTFLFGTSVVSALNRSWLSSVYFVLWRYKPKPKSLQCPLAEEEADTNLEDRPLIRPICLASLSHVQGFRPHGLHQGMNGQSDLAQWQHIISIKMLCTVLLNARQSHFSSSSFFSLSFDLPPPSQPSLVLKIALLKNTLQHLQ